MSALFQKRNRITRDWMSLLNLARHGVFGRRVGFARRVFHLLSQKA
jgi:hypothetical protein